MRKFALALVILAIASAPMVFAGEEMGKGTTHDLTVTLVSMDLDAHTITLKKPDGTEVTVPVKGEALASLKSKKVKAGETVVATCLDDEEGNHQAVTDLKPKA